MQSKVQIPTSHNLETQMTILRLRRLHEPSYRSGVVVLEFVPLPPLLADRFILHCETPKP